MAIIARPGPVFYVFGPKISRTFWGKCTEQSSRKKLAVGGFEPEKVRLLYPAPLKASLLSTTIKVRFLQYFIQNERKSSKIRVIQGLGVVNWTAPRPFFRIQKKLLPNYFSADFMIGENNRLINFDEALSETLFSNWCLIQEELDIVHNTALYCLSRVEMPVDMKCAFLIEAFIGVGEIIQSKKSEFVLPKRKSREESQLGLDLKYIISHYGQEIFRGEYQKDLEGFVQILVNSRNRIAHIKSKQNRKFLNGDESVLYLHKLSLMYRIILLDLLDIPLNRYKERLSNRIETINCWWADRCDQ